MPLKYLRRLLLSALVSEGSKAPLFQRVAKKTARMERDAPEKVAVWTRAAYVEARKDAETLWVKLREVLNSTAVLHVDGDLTMVSIKEYIHLIGDSVNDADTARLAEEAVNAPTLFFYGSLFELHSVQKLRNNPSFAWIPQLMEILCYGMVDELHLLPGSAKKHLTPCIYQKMNKLSVLSLCIRDDTGGMLFIRDVQGAIGASTPLEAEELLIEMMSDGLLHGRIDQRGGVMILQDFAAREVRIEEVGRLREKLETWCRNCDAQIEMLEEMMKE